MDSAEPVECLVTVSSKENEGEEAYPVGLIPLQQASVLVGDYNQGKSYLALWLATLAVEQGMRVLWIDGELGRRGFRKKVDDMPGTYETLLDNLIFYQEYPNESVMESLNDKCLIVVDSMTSLGCPPDGENAMPWLSKYVTDFRSKECTIILIDHRSYTYNRDNKALVGAGSKSQIMQGNILGVTGNPVFAPNHPGQLDLKVEKDNTGSTGLVINSIAAEVVVSDKCGFSIRAPGTTTSKVRKLHFY